MTKSAKANRVLARIEDMANEHASCSCGWVLPRGVRIRFDPAQPTARFAMLVQIVCPSCSAGHTIAIESAGPSGGIATPADGHRPSVQAFLDAKDEGDA
jgi:hypothetical protein